MVYASSRGVWGCLFNCLFIQWEKIVAKSGQQMKTLIKNIKDLKFYLENECTGVCKNWAWHYVQPGDVIIQPELAVHTDLTFNTGETEIQFDVKTQYSITMMLIISKLNMFYSV